MSTEAIEHDIDAEHDDLASAGLLATAGFQRWPVTGGFDGRARARDTDEMVWTAWKE